MGSSAMKLVRTAWCGALLVALALSACGREEPVAPVSPGVHTLSGHVKLTGFLVDADGNFAGTRVVGDADGVPVELVYGTQVVARTLTVGGVYRFPGMAPGGYTARTAAGPLHDQTITLTITGTDLSAADTLRLVAHGDLLPVPNPFGPHTVIYFNLEDTARVDLRVVDLAGNPVRQLVSGFRFVPGLRAAGWDGRDEAGSPASAAMYWLMFQAERDRDPYGIPDERIHLLFK